MSYQQFNMRCTKCSKTWTTAFGIVGTTQIATPTNKCPHCGATEIERADVQPQSPTPEAQPIGEAALLATDLLLDNFHWSKASDTDYDIFRRELERRLMLVISPENIKRMVDRFLQWKLPDNFNPDGGISFQRAINQNRPTWPQKNEPVGTNLLDADQAEEMVRYMLDGLAQSTPPEQRIESLTPMCEECCSNPCECAAHPEAVRMPELDITAEDREQARQDTIKCYGKAYRPESNDCLNFQLRRSEFRSRERQLLAALTELQTERAAHERTREELKVAWEARHQWFNATSEANSKRYVVERRVRELEAELASLRSELKNK